MKTGFLFTGLFFLINADIGTFDFLPDAVGYALIWYALGGIELFETSAERARMSFKRLIIISLFRTVSAVLLFSMRASAGASYDTGWSLCFVFVFACLEIWFGISAFSELFTSCDELILASRGHIDEKKRSNALTMTYIFVISKQVMCFAAETPFLWAQSLNDSMGMHVNYTLPLAAVNFTVTAAAGIIWYVLIRSYFNALRETRTAEYIRISVANTEKNDSGRVNRRRINTACALIGAGAVFSVYLSLENIDILPDFIGALLMLAGVYMLAVKRNTGVCAPMPRALPSAGIIYLAVSIARCALSLTMFIKYGALDSVSGFTEDLTSIFAHSSAAQAKFISLCVLSALSCILFIFFYRGAMKMLCDITDRYAARDPDGERSSGYDEITAGIKKKLNVSFVLCCLFSVFSAVQQFILPYIPALWFGTFVLSCAFCVAARNAVSSLSSSIRMPGDSL